MLVIAARRLRDLSYRDDGGHVKTRGDYRLGQEEFDNDREYACPASPRTL